MIHYIDVIDRIKTGRWSFKRTFKFLRKEKNLRELRDITLFEVLMKEYGRCGKLFTMSEITRYVNQLVNKEEYKREFANENIRCFMDINDMYYMEYLREKKKTRRRKKH